MTKRFILISGALVVAAGFLFVAQPALAHGGFGWGPFGGDHGERVADALGVTVEELQAAHDEAIEASLQAAVEAGQLTQEQADLRIAARTVARLEDRHGALAEALGMTADELQAELENGKRLGELAADREIDADGLRLALEQAREVAIGQALDDGAITQAQADALALIGSRGFGRGHVFGRGNAFGRGHAFGPGSAVGRGDGFGHGKGLRSGYRFDGSGGLDRGSMERWDGSVTPPDSAQPSSNL